MSLSNPMVGATTNASRSSGKGSAGCAGRSCGLGSASNVARVPAASPLDVSTGAAWRPVGHAGSPPERSAARL
eukprot:6589499-Pyramimonas_sp.AAC.1